MSSEPRLEPTQAGVRYTRKTGAYGWLFYGVSLIGLAAASYLALFVDAFSGYVAGMFLSIVAMLTGILFWTDRFVHRRWLPRAGAVEIEDAPGNYRDSTARTLRVDGQVRRAREVLVSTQRRRADGRSGVYAVLLDCEEGWVEVDQLGDLRKAKQLGQALADALSIPLRRTAAGAPNAAISPGRFLALLVPVLLYAPAIAVLEEKFAWVPLLMLTLHVLIGTVFELQVHLQSGAKEEAAFRSSAERTTARVSAPAVRVRVEPSTPEEQPLAAETGEAPRRVSRRPQ